MREHERLLHQDIERCVDILQETVDSETAKAISVFSKKTSDNEEWLKDLKGRFKLKEEGELERLLSLKEKQQEQIEEVEKKIDYWEKLCDELEEFQAEIEVKTKLEQSRRSRLNSMNS